MDTMSDYETNARHVAERIGIMVRVARHREQTCPTWSEGKRCDHVHGLRYRVTLSRKHDHRHKLSFDFWNSRSDADKGIDPGYYDILACVSSDISMSTNPDEVAEELGPMRPSQAIAAARHARRLQAFFTERERALLGEIQ